MIYFLSCRSTLYETRLPAERSVLFRILHFSRNLSLSSTISSLWPTPQFCRMDFFNCLIYILILWTTFASFFHCFFFFFVSSSFSSFISLLSCLIFFCFFHFFVFSCLFSFVCLLFAFTKLNWLTIAFWHFKRRKQGKIKWKRKRQKRREAEERKRQKRRDAEERKRKRQERRRAQKDFWKRFFLFLGFSFAKPLSHNAQNPLESKAFCCNFPFLLMFPFLVGSGGSVAAPTTSTTNTKPKTTITTKQKETQKTRRSRLLWGHQPKPAKTQTKAKQTKKQN